MLPFAGKRRKRRGVPETRGRIPNRVSIGERPAEANERSELGHWEADTFFADPMAALQKRGLPTSGDVELELSLTFTTPKELGEFREWMKRKTKAAKKTAKRRKKQRLEMERRDEEARIEEEGRQIALGGLVTLVVGICLGGLFFGGDGED